MLFFSRFFTFCRIIRIVQALFLTITFISLIDMKTASASTGCDTANAGGYDVTTGIGGVSVLNFNGDFDTGDVIQFSTDANNLLVSLVNVNTGLTAIAGVGVLTANFTIIATQNYNFTGTLTAVVLNTTTLTVRCTPAAIPPGGPTPAPTSPNKETKTSITNKLVSAFMSRDSMFADDMPGQRNDVLNCDVALFQRRIALYQNKIGFHQHALRRNPHQYLARAQMRQLKQRINHLKRAIRGSNCRESGQDDNLAYQPGYISEYNSSALQRRTLSPRSYPASRADPSIRADPFMEEGEFVPIQNIELQGAATVFFSNSAQIQQFSSKQPGELEGHMLTHSYKVTKKISDKVIAQAFIQLRHGQADLFDEPVLPGEKSEMQAHFYGVGTRVLLHLDPTLSLQLASMYEAGHGKIQIADDVGKLNMQSVKLGARLEGSYTHGDWRLTPSAGIEYSYMTRDSFRDSAESTIDGAKQQSGRVTFGPELQYSFVHFMRDDVMTLHPFMRVQGSWVFLHDDKIGSATRFAPSKNEVVLNYGAGLRIAIPNKFALLLHGNMSDWRNGSDLAFHTQMTVPILRESREARGQLKFNTSAARGGIFQGNVRASLPLETH